MALSDFQKTYEDVTKAQARVSSLEMELSKAKAVLTLKFAAHAGHFKRQSGLALQMGIGGPYLNDILKGKRGVSKTVVERLLGASLENEK